MKKSITSKLHSLQQSLATPIQKTGDDLSDTEWIKTYYHLTDKDTQQVVLFGDVINEEQEQFLAAIEECEHTGRIPMFLILKARQLGFSTVTQAIMFCRMMRRVNYHCGTVSHVESSSVHLFGMSRLAYETLDLTQRKPLSHHSKGIMKCSPPHRSGIVIGTAEDEQLFSSLTLNAFHGSELAKWRRPRNPYTAAMQCIPMNPSSLIVWEFTAQGRGNLAYELWKEALSGKNAYQPLFFSFRNYKPYQIPLQKGERLHLTLAEQEFQDKWHLTNPQMKWVLWIKKNKCHDDWNFFNQEYPIDESVAFSATSNSYFDQEILYDMLHEETGSVKDPLYTGTLVWTDESPPSVRIVEDPTGPWEIYELPEPGDYYVIGGDIGEGIYQDYSVLQILRAPAIIGQPIRQVAKFRSHRITADYVGLEAYLGGVLYNTALIGIEYNGAGSGSLTILERGWPGDVRTDANSLATQGGYPNLYYYTPGDRRLAESSGRIGWRTNRTTKRMMLGMLKSRIADKSIVLRSLGTIKELLGFAYDPESADYIQTYEDPVTRKGQDDEILALAVADQMVRFYMRGRFFRRIESWEDVDGSVVYSEPS